MVKYIDTFNYDIDEFKKSIDKESDIAPEIIIQTHLLFDLIDRMRVMDKIKNSSSIEIQEMPEKINNAIKRAQFHSLENVFNKFFSRHYS